MTTDLIDEYGEINVEIKRLQDRQKEIRESILEMSDDLQIGDKYVTERQVSTRRSLNRDKVMKKFGVDDLSDCEIESSSTRLYIRLLDASAD